MNAASFLDRVKSGKLLCDGAMGTQLMLAGMQPGECGEMMCIDKPDAVAAIHGRYAAAGCDLVTTNSFGATRTMLVRHGVDGRLAEINAAAVKVARQGAPSAVVLGDIGPFGDFLEPVGDVTPEQCVEIFAQQAAALREGGADGAIIETMSDAAEMALAIKAAHSVGDWPVIATYAFIRTNTGAFKTANGLSLQAAMDNAIEAGAHVVGANCGTSLTLPDYLDLARQLVMAAKNTPVILQPNAGSPAPGIQQAGPAEMGAIAAPLRKIGISILGGCCGTTPEHLAVMAAAWKS